MAAILSCACSLRRNSDDGNKQQKVADLRSQDDRVEFNTQTSSQWDSFRHWSYPDGRFYNGATQEEVRDGLSTRNGIHGWSPTSPELSFPLFRAVGKDAETVIEWAKKGIIGRGVLVDFYSYAIEKGLQYDPWSFHKISVSLVEEIAIAQGVTFRPGDILLLRTGRFSESLLPARNLQTLP